MVTNQLEHTPKGQGTPQIKMKKHYHNNQGPKDGCDGANRNRPTDPIK
jgi:hypothetical protein